MLVIRPVRWAGGVRARSGGGGRYNREKEGGTRAKCLDTWQGCTLCVRGRILHGRVGTFSLDKVPGPS